MWVFLSDCFLSIVDKDCGPHEVLVRARRAGDIEKLFPRAKIVRLERADYLFRAVVSRREVASALASEVMAIRYPNFKSSVRDESLHDAYMRVWTAMASVQPTRPYSGGIPMGPFDLSGSNRKGARKTNRKRTRKAARA